MIAFSVLSTVVVVAVAGSALFAPRLWPDERRSVAMLRIGGATVLAAVAYLPAYFYDYAIAISAGLCGHQNGWPEAFAVAVPLLVVGAWGLRGRHRVLFAWPAAVFSAAACLSLAAYLDPSAHGQCETMTPYSRIEVGLSRYSTMSSAIRSSPRRNATPAGDSSSMRQSESSLL